MNNQTLKLVDRSFLEISNVKNIISFDANEFLIDSILGNLKITGKNLTIGKMDTEKQELIIKGNIDTISYTNNKNLKESKKESIFSKIFK